MNSSIRPAADRDAGVTLAHRTLGLAFAFLAITGILGAWLRWQAIAPAAWPPYRQVLHAHSHVGFLGWVFNAFVAVALLQFVPADRRVRYGWLIALMQLGVIGMLVAFPLQGYGAVSIAFSTLHLVAAGGFAVRLWREGVATPVARGSLRLALVWMLASGLGPLALGPITALGGRDSPAYHLAVYFYLHAQYNGWFVFFLQALALQLLTGGGAGLDHGRIAVAVRWLAIGSVLTFAQSTLWLEPPAAVRLIALAGGLAQGIGFAGLLRSVWPRWTDVAATVRSRRLVELAVINLVLKFALQIAVVLPGLAAFAGNRLVVIAFLHLVFLGVVTPALWAWAWTQGGLAWTLGVRIARVGFLAAAAVTEVILIAAAAGATDRFPTAGASFAAALVMALAGIELLPAAWSRRRGRAAG